MTQNETYDLKRRVEVSCVSLMCLKVIGHAYVTGSALYGDT